MTMGIKEAKLHIAKEFIDKYIEWMNDHNNAEMSDREYGMKYGWARFTSPVKDTQKSVIYFQSHCFNGKYRNEYLAEGIDAFELHRIGFLSYDYCTSYEARAKGKVDFFYINQNKAKEIYKAYKNGFFN